MKLKCVSTKGVLFRYKFLTEGKEYTVFSLSFSIRNCFLVFDDSGEWREYPPSLFIPLTNETVKT